MILFIFSFPYFCGYVYTCHSSYSEKTVFFSHNRKRILFTLNFTFLSKADFSFQTFYLFLAFMKAPCLIKLTFLFFSRVKMSLKCFIFSLNGTYLNVLSINCIGIPSGVWNVVCIMHATV